MSKAFLICEAVDLSAPAILPRSYLYPVEPICIGTCEVESLTSYITRLAETHGVSTGVLVARVIAPDINKNYILVQESLTMSQPFSAGARALNGTGSMAKQWVDALENLTLRRDLSFMNMLTWRNVIHKNFLRRYRAWCPACYEERSISGLEIYDQLIWSINIVDICIRHKQKLCVRCINCQRQLPVLAARSQPGYCSSCGSWLGISPNTQISSCQPVTEKDLDMQTGIISQIGQLLSEAPKLLAEPTKGNVAQSVFTCIDQLARGNVTIFMRQFSLEDYPHIRLWLKGTVIPNLSSALDFCHRVNIRLFDVLTGNIAIEKPKLPLAIRRAKSTRNYTLEDLAHIRTNLLNIIDYEPPLSLVETCKLIECSKKFLRRHFLEECNKIAARYREYKKRPISRRKILSIFRAAYDEIPPPSLLEIARRCGCLNGWLKKSFPEESSLLIKRRAEYRRGIKDIEQAREKLEELSKHSPPLPLTECAKCFALPTGRLYYYFPDLSAEIVARYDDYKKELASRRKDQRREAIRNVIFELHSKGIYPSQKSVRRAIRNITGVGQTELRSLLKETRKELNLE